MTDLPFISGFHVISPIQATKQVVIQLSGQWPTPGWDHIKTKVDLEEGSKVMTIQYLGKSKGGMMMQVIQPFEDRISVTFPTSGEWKVIVKGRSGEMEQIVDVT